MSARSCWNTCGTVFQACVSLCAVVRRTPLIGLRSIAPHLLKSGSASAAAADGRAAPAPDSSRRAYAVTSSIEMRPPGPEP